MLNRITNNELPYYSEKAKLTVSQLIKEGTNYLDIMSNDAYFIDLIGNPMGKELEISNYLKRRIANNNDLQIGFVSDTSQFFYSPNSSPGKVTMQNSAWYFEFLKQPKDRAFNVNQSSKTKQIKLWVQQKEYSLDGKFLGVAYIGYDIKKITQFILSQNFDNKGQTMMVGLDGGIKIHRDSAKIDYNNSLKAGHTLASLEGIGENAKQLMTKNDTNFLYTKPNGETHLIISKYISEFEWIMLIDVSVNQIIKPLRNAFITTLLWGLLFTIIMVSLISVLISRVALKPIKKMSSFINLFAEGDLKVGLTISSSDEIGEFAVQLKQMQKKLLEIVTKIKEGSLVINKTGINLNHRALIVASSSNEQAANIEEVSSSIEQILFKVNQNMLNSQGTKQISDKSYQELATIHKLVDATSISMMEIDEKVSVISEIASKTDMLAINAAIEAARAGEKGKGFGVVAQEVRKLAEKSSRAAIEIGKISKKNVELAQQSIKLLNAVMPDIEKTSQLVNQITEASIEQNANVNEINSAVIQLSQISLQNSSAADEVTSSSAILIQQAQELNNKIAFFK